MQRSASPDRRPLDTTRFARDPAEHRRVMVGSAQQRLAEIAVCINTCDGDGAALGGDEELYGHARLAAEFGHRFATDHTALRDDEDFWTRCGERFSEKLLADFGVVVCPVAGNGAGSTDSRDRPELQADVAQSGLNRHTYAREVPRHSGSPLHNYCHDHHTARCRGDRTTRSRRGGRSHWHGG